MATKVGILSKGITLSYKDSLGSSYTLIPHLQEVPDIGGSADKVDVTTLADENYKYINGIKDFGDLAFKFVYDNTETQSNYRLCRKLEETGEAVDWKVTFPDNTEFTFSGEASTAIDGAGVNDALTFTLNITLNSDIVVKNPTE